jgi:hypothetical protein
VAFRTLVLKYERQKRDIVDDDDENDGRFRLSGFLCCGLLFGVGEKESAIPLEMGFETQKTLKDVKREIPCRLVLLLVLSRKTYISSAHNLLCCNSYRLAR